MLIIVVQKKSSLRRSDTVIVAPKSCVSKVGVAVKILQAGEEMTVGKISVKAVEAYNYKRFRSSGKPWHPKGYGVGYLITLNGKTIYHAGDTDFIPEMKQLEQVDVALLPTGNKYTMDKAEAAEATVAINPKVVIPMHTWEKDPEEFKKKVEARSQIRVVVLENGEELVLE